MCVLRPHGSRLVLVSFTVRYCLRPESQVLYKTHLMYGGAIQFGEERPRAHNKDRAGNP